MNLQTYYWYFDRGLTPRLCDEIKKFALFSKPKVATVTGLRDNIKTRNLEKDPLDEKETKVLHKVRKSNVVWLNEPWIFKEINPFLHEANKRAGWNFEISWSESIQFTCYKKGHFYTWHHDASSGAYKDANNLNTFNKMRKLSMIINLTDPNEYKGGELQFCFNDKEPGKNKPSLCREVKPRGSVVVFPSFLWHRVTPVTKGVRYSLVCWNLGKAYV